MSSSRKPDYQDEVIDPQETARLAKLFEGKTVEGVLRELGHAPSPAPEQRKGVPAEWRGVAAAIGATRDAYRPSEVEWLPLDVAIRLAQENPGTVTVGLVQSIAKAVHQLRASQAPAVGAPLLARAKAEWHEDDGPVLWWAWNGNSRGWADETPWIGTPLDDDWPGWHTHWTAHPAQPAGFDVPVQGTGDANG